MLFDIFIFVPILKWQFVPNLKKIAEILNDSTVKAKMFAKLLCEMLSKLSMPQH